MVVELCQSILIWTVSKSNRSQIHRLSCWELYEEAFELTESLHHSQINHSDHWQSISDIEIEYKLRLRNRI